MLIFFRESIKINLSNKLVMKIGFLTPEFPHEKISHSAGIGSSISNLAFEMLKQQHQVIVIVYGQDTDEIIQLNGLTIYKIKNVKLKGFSWYLTRKKIEKLINKLYAQAEIDILEAPDWTGITSFIIPKHCPIVIKLHGSDTYFCELEHRKVKWINKFHEKRALNKATAIASVSQFTADITKQLFGLNTEIKVIHNGISLDKFGDTFPFLESEEKIILYFGTLIRKKGVLELPGIFNQVFKQNNQVQLFLVGKDSGDFLSQNNSTWALMKSGFTKEAFNNVTYIGAIPYHEMKDQISKAHICVFPSFAEALPVSWIEAMAMGKAIVASNVGWAPEMIDNGKDGFLENPTQHQLFAQRVLDLLDNDLRREEMGNQAVLKIRNHFDISKICAQNIDFYQRIIKSLK